jgi:NADH-quinone oxidoreductase subunit G/NADP-reducing hydrogenase subunit HndD
LKKLLKMKNIKFKINNKEVEGVEGETILHVARRNNIKIPAACYHSDLEPETSCRLCLISIAGRKGLFTSCSVEIEEGMDVTTDSPEIKEIRKTNLELIFSQHIEKCGNCVRNYHCRLLSLAKECGIKISEFKDRKQNFPKYQFGPSIIFDSSKCIDCHNCVAMCDKQGVGFLNVEENRNFWEVVPSKDIEKDCIYCGQCLIHCPSGAFEEVSAVSDVEKALEDKKKFVVFQFAPSIRSSLGEEFGLDYGTVVTGKMIAGIRKLGADRVFDVSVGADVTTIEEGGELIERLTEKKGLPMFTSCCPSWVKYVEFYYPQFIKNLTTVRSPQIILGGLTKTYLAEKEKINPKNIVVVSIMPCTSKKFEATREELNIDGLKPIDYVLTTRELACLFKKNNINLAELKDEEPDTPWNKYTGAGVIYGATGGVTESALRTVYEKVTGKKLKQIEFKELRGMEGCREAVVKIGDISVKIAIINGLGNAKCLLERLKENPSLYDYVEVMACSGGCIGGGGQPLPTDREIRKKRAMALYGIDKEWGIRMAHESPVVELLYKDFFKNKKKIHEICHTHYSPKEKDKIKIIK